MKILRQDGMTLVELMIAMGVSMVLFMGMLQMQQIMNKGQTQSNTTLQTDSIHRNLLALVYNSNSWKNTTSAAINGASGLNCLNNGKPCTNNGTDLPTATPPGTGAALSGKVINAVFNADLAPGSIFYDSTKPDSGFTAQGALCSGFVPPPAVGSDYCSLRYDISWTAVCGTSCINPQVKLNIIATYNPKSSAYKIAFNPANYSSTGLLLNGANSVQCKSIFAGPNAAATADAICPAGYTATGGGCWTGTPGNDNIALGAPWNTGDALTNPAASIRLSPPASNTAPASVGPPNAWHCWSNDNTTSAYAVCCQ